MKQFLHKYFTPHFWSDRPLGAIHFVGADYYVHYCIYVGCKAAYLEEHVRDTTPVPDSDYTG